MSIHVEHHKIKLQVVLANAKNRKDGYVEDVIASGTQDGEFITLSDKEFQRIRREYFPKKISLPKKEVQLPSVSAMAKTVTKSIGNWLRSGAPLTKEDELEKRLDACKKCEFWNSEALRGTGRCNKCGCSTWAKLRIATEKCPIGKW